MKNRIIKLKEIRKEKELIISSNKQCIEYEEDCIKVYRIKNGKRPDSLIILLEKILVSYGIDKSRYHGGKLEGTSIQKLLQNANEIFNDFKEEIMKIVKEKDTLTIVDKEVSRYIEICTLFDALFSLSRTPCGEMNDDKLNQLNEIIKLSMLKWRNLRMSMKMIKIHGVEDHLFDQIKHFNGIGCFIEDFIEQAHQFGNLDESRTSKLRDREKAFNHHSTYEWIGLNGNVITKTVEVKKNSKRKMKQNNLFITKKKIRQSKRQLTRLECIETAPLCNIDVVEDISLRKR